MHGEEFTLSLDDLGEVRAVYTRPEADQPRGGLVLAHGAENDLNHRLLLSIHDAAVAAGFGCYRFNFPYREQGRWPPDPPRILSSAMMAAAFDASQRLRVRPDRIVLGGKNLGARVASLAAARRFPTAGLLLLGYPLHSPDPPYLVEEDHLARIRIPMLFVRGTVDSLCHRRRLDRLLSGLRAPTTVHDVTEGDHSFEAPRHSMRSTRQTWRDVVKTSVAWLEERVPARRN